LDTRINGASFEDSPLNAGDRLAVGPIEFEVLPTEVTTQTTVANEVSASPAALANEVVLNQEREQIARDKQALEKSRDELNAKLAKFESEQSEWQRSQSEGAHDLHLLRTELDQQTQ